MRLSRQLTLVAAAAVLASGCGSDDEPEGKGLPRATVAALKSRLDEVERRYQDAIDNGNVGACNDIQNDSFSGAGGIGELLQTLPDDVDPEIRDATNASFRRLQDLTREACADVEPPQTETTAPETETETAPPETVPTETETTPTLPSEEKPKKQKKDNGNGNGNGGGSGGVVAPEGDG